MTTVRSKEGGELVGAIAHDSYSLRFLKRSISQVELAFLLFRFFSFMNVPRTPGCARCPEATWPRRKPQRSACGRARSGQRSHPSLLGVEEQRKETELSTCCSQYQASFGGCNVLISPPLWTPPMPPVAKTEMPTRLAM